MMLQLNSIAEMWDIQIKDTLRTLVPAVDFQTWIASLTVVKVDSKNTIYLSTGNHIGAEIIMNRYSGILDKAWSSCLGKPVRCQVIALDSVPDDTVTNRSTDSEDSIDTKDSVLIQPVYGQDLRDCFIQSDRVVSIPKSLLRWISYLTPTLSSMIISFRQACYFQHDTVATKSFSSSISELSRWAGIDRSTFFRNLSDPRLSWFISRGQSGKTFFDHKRGHPVSPESVFKFKNSHMPVPPGDILYLRTALIEAGIKKDPVRAIKKLLSTQPFEIIPRLASIPPKDWQKLDPNEWTFEHTISSLIGDKMDGNLGALSAELREHLWPDKQVVMLTWYEFLDWQKVIGSSALWMIVYLRSLTYHNNNTSESRTETKISIKDLSRVVGVSDRTIRRWLLHTVTVDDSYPSDTLNRQEKLLMQQNFIKQFVDVIGKSSSNPMVKVAWTPPLTSEDDYFYNITTRLMKFLDTSPASVRNSLIKDIEDIAGSDDASTSPQTGHDATPTYPQFDRSTTSPSLQTGHDATPTYPQTGHDATPTYPQAGHDATLFKDTMRHIKCLKLNSFLRLLNYLKQQYPDKQVQTSDKKQVVVASESGKTDLPLSAVRFDYDEIYSRLAQNNPHKKHKRGTLSQLISLVLYISSPEGCNLTPGFVISRLGSAQKAGFPYDLIAEWSPAEIVDYIKNPPQTYSTNKKDQIWAEAFSDKNRYKASKLLYWLTGELDVLS